MENKPTLDQLNQTTINNMQAMFQTLMGLRQAEKAVQNFNNKLDVFVEEINHNFKQMQELHAEQQQSLTDLDNKPVTPPVSAVTAEAPRPSRSKK
jgi:hypothetical protein